MSALRASTNLTPEEADLLPDAERFELYDGELREREMAIDSTWIGGNIFVELANYARATGGMAFTDGAGLALWPNGPRTMVRPDACFFAAGRLPTGRAPRDAVLTIPPDVAVEVISPGDIFYRASQKTADYLAAGVRSVWIVVPNTRLIQIHRPGAIQLFQAGSKLEDLPELPGFSCDVSSLFPEPDESDFAALD